MTDQYAAKAAIVRAAGGPFQVEDVTIEAPRADALLTSPDAVTWQPTVLDPAVLLNAVTYGGSLFVAVGEAGTILSLRSC